MTVSEWIKANGKTYKYAELTVVYNDSNAIILDDRIAYLPYREDSYNKNWKAKCRGKQIQRIVPMPKGIALFI